MLDKRRMTETYCPEWRRSAGPLELMQAAADVLAAAQTAREAGRTLTAAALFNEARDIAAQRRRLLRAGTDASGGHRLDDAVGL